MINPFSLFKRNDVDLKQKWWHRLVVVLYIALLMAVAGAALIGHFHGDELVKKHAFNTIITNTWEEYTVKQSDGFSEAQKKQYNTYRAEGMSLEDSKRLAETPSFYGFLRSGDNKAGCFAEDGSFSLLSEYTSDATKERICDGNNSIVTYQENWIYHVQGIFYTILLVLLWSVAAQLLYYKVFLFVVFGSNKKR